MLTGSHQYYHILYLVQGTKLTLIASLMDLKTYSFYFISKMIKLINV